MNSKNKHTGITLLGFAILLCVVGFLGYAAMKLVPAYIEYFGVLKSISAVQTDPQLASVSIDQVRARVFAQFNLQYVDENNVPMSAITVNTQNGARSLTVAYDRDIPFIYNIDFLVHFSKTVDLSHGLTE
jgi:hypothetical protein